MRKNLTKLIEAWVAKHEDGEFGPYPRAHPFSVIGPITEGGCIIFTSKRQVVLHALEEQKRSLEVGMIGRYGLPGPRDLRWIAPLIGTRELVFLGDMDPVDLMVFAWLRAGLHPKRVAHAGVNDAFIKAVKFPSVESLILRCQPSERRSLAFLKKVFPDLGKTVGPKCAQMLEQGRKIELDGFGNDRKTRAAIVRLVRSQGRRGESRRSL